MLKVTGSKGGGKGGGSSPVEAANTLQSNIIAHIVELLGEGEIVGLVDKDGNPVTNANGARAIFFDQTPAQDDNGVALFRGLTWDQRTGQPDQDYLNGSGQTETPIAVNAQVKQGTGPVTRTITDVNVDAVRIITRIPALASQDDQGNTNPNSVQYHLDVRSSGGAWQTVVTETISNQKCTSPWNKAHLIKLPAGGAPWDVRMVRDTGDSTDIKNQNDTYWESYSEIIQGKFIYPDSAVVSLEIDASQFGTSLPARAYRAKGLLTNVPSNWDPVTRVYTGIWDGTFKKAWHNSPVWVFYDLIENSRYGLGEFIDASIIDKWGLYTIARYCDQLVPSGFKDPGGNDIMEPRFTFNGVISNREEAFKVLQNVAAAFRGMAYWSLGQVFAAADMPADPVTTIAPANVIDGHFKYSGTALKARHSVALVTWFDPDDFYRPAIEVVQNDEMLARYGWREVQINAIGCTSRGQAHRYGKWILDSEQNETETVEFTMSWDGYVRENNATLKPGDIILVADPRKAGGVRAGGRFKAVADASTVTIDAPFAPTAGITYTLNAVLPDGTLESKAINAFSTDNLTLTLAAAFTQAPQAGAMWSISGTDINPRRYRIMAVKENDDHLFAVTALFNDPGKYARVEQNIAMDPIVYTRPKSTVGQVSGVTVSENRFFLNGINHSRVTISWTPPSDLSAVYYTVTADTPNGRVEVGKTMTPSIDITDATPGNWIFHICSVALTGASSQPVDFTYTALGWEALDKPTVGNLALSGGGTTFVGNAPTITWTNSFPPDTPVFVPENIVRVYDVSNNLLREELVKTTSYTYSYENNLADGGPRRALRFDVTVKSATGEESAAVTISVNNPPPAAITATLTPNAGMLEITYAKPVDPDFAGARIWLSTVSGFDPNSTQHIYDGPDSKVTVGVSSSGTCYVRVGLYDSFDKASMIIGPEASTAISSVDERISQVANSLLNLNGAATTIDLENVADSIAALINQMILDRDENDTLHQQTRQMLSVRSDGLSAMVLSEQSARVTADYAEATARTALQATINDTVLAQLATEQIARADADSALSSDITSLSTTVNGNTASISTVQQSVDGVSVKYGVIGTINGVTGGFVFQGIQKLDGSVSYSVEIQGDLIVDGSIVADKLSINDLSALSANVGRLTAGKLSDAVSDDLAHMIIDLAAGTITGYA